MLVLADCEQSEVVCYATDGGVLRRLKNLVVCGPGSIDQAHRADEWISLEQLEKGTLLYRRLFEFWSAKV
jgi:acetylornithine deacetylase